jgi:hypothetical protein
MGAAPLPPSHCKINRKNQNSVILGIFAEKPLSFFIINPRPTNFSVQSKIRKILIKRSLASENPQNSSKIPKIHIFSTTTPNPVILVPKFLESLPLSFYAFI